MMLLQEVYEYLEKEIWEVLHCNHMTPAYAEALHHMISTLKDIKKMEYYEKSHDWMDEAKENMVYEATMTASTSSGERPGRKE